MNNENNERYNNNKYIINNEQRETEKKKFGGRVGLDDSKSLNDKNCIHLSFPK